MSLGVQDQSLTSGVPSLLLVCLWECFHHLCCFPLCFGDTSHSFFPKISLPNIDPRCSKHPHPFHKPWPCLPAGIRGVGQHFASPPNPSRRLHSLDQHYSRTGTGSFLLFSQPLVLSQLKKMLGAEETGEQYSWSHPALEQWKWGAPSAPHPKEEQGGVFVGSCPSEVVCPSVPGTFPALPLPPSPGVNSHLIV